MGGSDVVGDAVEGNFGGLGVEEGEAGAPVAIAGLANGAGVEEVAFAGRELEGPGFGVGAGVKLGAELVPMGGGRVAVESEAALQMGVADEGDGGGALMEGCPGVAHAEDVVIFVERGAVGEGDGGKKGGGVEVGDGGGRGLVIGGGGGAGGNEDFFFGGCLAGAGVERALGEVAKPGEVGFGEFGHGPGDGGAGGGVEVDGGGETTADAVVVAADGDGGERADEVDDLVGAAAVADGVAEIPDGVEAAGSGGEDGGKGFEVGVDVGENEGAHGGAGSGTFMVPVCVG